MIVFVNILSRIFEIIVTILKVIGIVLLSVLGFIALLFILIFLVPVRYRVSAENDKTDMTGIKAEGRVTYLLHMISVYFRYIKGEGTYYSVKLFGFTVAASDKPRKNKKRKKNKEEEYSDDEDLTGGVEASIPDTDDTVTEKISDSADNNVSDEPGQNTENIGASETTNAAGATNTEAEDSAEDIEDPNIKKKREKEARKEAKKQAKEAKKQAREEKKRLKQAKKHGKKGASGSKLDEARKKYEEFRKIIDNPANRRLFTKVKKEVFYLLKHFLPRKVKGHMDFGFTSPDTTGKILGVMSFFPFLYTNGFKVRPDFETDKTYFCGQIEMKGKIRLIHVLKTAVVLFLDKQFRLILFKKKFY